MAQSSAGERPDREQDRIDRGEGNHRQNEHRELHAGQPGPSFRAQTDSIEIGMLAAAQFRQLRVLRRRRTIAIV